MAREGPRFVSPLCVPTDRVSRKQAPRSQCRGREKAGVMGAPLNVGLALHQVAFLLSKAGFSATYEK